MSCDRTLQVHAYHDDRMSPDSRAELESHLAACADCSQLLTDLRSLSLEITNAPLPELSQSSLNHYYSAWDLARQGGLLRIASWLTGAAAAVLVGSLMLLPGENPPEVASGPAISAWEAVALMPPPERTTDRPDELVELAQWMAEDLSQQEVR